MKCAICGQAETIDGQTTLTLGAIEFRNVPAQVCPNCGEAFMDDQAAAILLKYSSRMQNAGQKKVAFFDSLPQPPAEEQTAILARIRQRRSFSPADVGAPDTLTLLREDRER